MTQMGVTVTLREIYDAVQRCRQEIQDLATRVTEVERQLSTPTTPAYLKKLGYSIGLLAAGAAAGWGALRGGG